MPTLRDAVFDYLLIDRALTTNENYKRILLRMARAIGPTRDVALITSADLRGYLRWLDERRPLKRSTLQSYHQVIRTFFAWCRDEEYVRRSPARNLALRRLAEPTTHRRGIPPDQLRDMLLAAKWHKRDYALLLFLLDTACRVGGAASLTNTHLYLDKYSALVQEKGGRWVMVYYGDQTVAALQAWLAVRPDCEHDYVFIVLKGAPIPLTERPISHVVRRYARLVGAIDPADGRPYGAHALRHSTAEALVRRGVPPYVVQGKLNHQRLSTTLNHYYPEGDSQVPAISQTHALAALDDPYSTDHEQEQKPNPTIRPFRPKSETG